MRTNEKINTTCSLITAFCAFFTAITVFFSFFPSLNPFNDNLLEKAEAGNAHSQMLLAEHYFEVKEYDQSLYWYKIVSVKESKYQDIALNNMGYIYAENLVANTDAYFYDKAVSLFRKSSEAGNAIATKNLYFYLIKNSKNFVKTTDYYEELKYAQDILKNSNLEILYLNEEIWEYQETIISNIGLRNDGETMYNMVGSDYVYKDNSSMQWVYTYEVYKKSSDTNLDEYNLSYISEFE